MMCGIFTIFGNKQFPPNSDDMQLNVMEWMMGLLFKLAISFKCACIIKEIEISWHLLSLDVNDCWIMEMFCFFCFKTETKCFLGVIYKEDADIDHLGLDMNT